LNAANGKRAPLSIALRLGLLFAAIAVAVFVGVGAYLYQTLAMQMARRDDVELLNKAALVRQLLRTLPPDERMPRQMQAVLAPAIGQDGVMLRVALPDGRVLVQTVSESRHLPALVPVPLDRLPRRADVVDLDGPPSSARVLDVLSAYGQSQVRVTLVRTRSDRLAILKRYGVDLLGALLAGALVATALGFWAVRRGLHPLHGVIAKANEINAQRLTTRLALDGVPAELHGLGIAFNAMLERLEEGVQRLSGFGADLAHDMRTPVNALMMQTQVALARERTCDEYQALLGSNLEEYERLARMIENTLFLARADNAQLALQREPLDAGAELAHIRDYFDVLAEDQDVALTLEAAPGMLLAADPVLLRRAVSNLVSNALAHTPAGGQVRLRASVDTRADSRWLAIAVANTGAGIARAHLAHVFERYYRADPARAAASSAGLGLAIVRAIMRLHGGSAEVASEPDAETVFTLRFPLHAA
jgi:two-component system heavy metal sensor histidine kinase CusS